MNKTIVCFGDSNTHGYQAETNGRFNEGERYPCLLNQYLGSSYYVKEEGMSGRTTVFDDPLFEGLSGLSVIFPCLLTHEPIDLLIIMLGTNDVKERFRVNAANIGKGMERLVQKAIHTKEAWRHKPNILLIAPPPIEKGYETTSVLGEMGYGCVEKSQQLAFYYEEIAKRLGCHFLDAETLGLKMHPKDYMHLDKESHKKLAEKLAQIIPKIIE